MYIRMIVDSLSVNVNAVPTLIRKEKERLTLASNVASAWAGGAKMDFMKFLFEGNAEAFKSKPGATCGDVQLPILSWDPQRFWINTTPPWLKQQPTTSARTAPLEKCMYESVWVPTQPAPKSRNDKLTLVLFHDHMTNETPTRFSISESLLQHLKQHNIVHVELGSSFSRTGKDSFTSSTSAESLAALADELPKDISGFVYCWSNLSSECDCSTTVLGPVRLLQALNKTSPCKTKFWVITHACFGVGNAMNMNPFQSPIKGIFETAAFEFPQMKPTVVDISSQADIPLLAKEISNSTIESSMESTVALLNGQKLVKRMKLLPTSDSSKWSSLAVDPKGTYLMITGGLSGFGLEIANWLTEKGAKSLILCGRSAPKPEAALRIEKMRKNGEVSIEVAQVDVSDIQQLSVVVKKANNLMGIFHVAGVFGAARIQDLTTESIKNVLDSKIVGSWNLHLASQTVSTLQHFVLFSSLASAVPQGGQAHYTAANCFLDALAQFRRKLHLPALSIQYKQDTRAEEMSAKVGLYTLNVADTLRALGYLAGTKTPAQVLVARVDWGKYVGDLPVVSGLLPKKEEPAAEEEEKKPVKTQEEIQNWLTAEFAEALQSSPTAIDIDTPLRNFGVESMVVVNITAALSDWLGVRVSPALVYDFPTISLLSKHLAELMQPHKETLPVVPTWTTSTPTDDSEVIALVGFALWFPGGCTDSDSYWSLLKNGVDAITEIPQSRFNVHAFYDADMQKKGKMNSKWGGFISDIDMFEAEFWGISPREAERLDPQQRLMMEMAWEALEDSGHPASMLAGSKTGLFVGLSVSDYGQLQVVASAVVEMQDIHLTDQALPLVDSLLLQSESSESSESSTGTPESSSSSLELWNVPVLTVWASNNDEFVKSLLQLDTAPKSWTNTLTRLSNRPPQPEDKGRATLSLSSATTPGDHWTMFSPPDNMFYSDFGTSRRPEDELLSAVSCGNAETTFKVLAHNPTIDINGLFTRPGTFGGNTLLHEAGSASVVRLLLTSPPPPHRPYTDVNRVVYGRTPLSVACSHDKGDVVRELLGVVGIDPNKGYPLWVASREGHVGVVRLLLGHPHTDVNLVEPSPSCDTYGTPLAEALIHGHMEVARILVVRGGTVNEETQYKVDKAMGGHDKYERWLQQNAHPQVEAKDKLRIKQLEEEVRELNTKLSAMASSLTQREHTQQIMRKELTKEKSDLESKHNSELKAAINECEKLKSEHTRETILLEKKHNSAKKEWEQATKILNEQHTEELNQMNKKLRQVQEQQQEESNSIGPKTATTFPELNEAFRLATLFQNQLKKSAPQFILLGESLEKLRIKLEGATKHNEELASQLQQLSGLKCTLARKLNKSDAACKKILGKNLTVWNSEAEIQECSRNISSLTKMWGMKGLMAEKNIIALTEECEPVDERLLEPLIVPVKPQDDYQLTPPFQVLCTLTDTLAQLQSCRFDECTKLADKHTVLSKELSEQETLGSTLHKAIKETQRECSELRREHKTKLMVQRGLEGDEQFIGVPDVRSMLSELLPQAQHAIVELSLSKASSCLGTNSNSNSSSNSDSNSNNQSTPTAGCTSSPPDVPPSTTSHSDTVMVMVCIECDERPPNMQFQPCGHVVLCSQCGSTVKKCPHCRVQIKAKIQIP
ncbi:beta-ketoacyl synthase [Pelomyxa schiedti]|nr:beta-ketoacyl synthase [Pelomyxa schiedti]